MNIKHDEWAEASGGYVQDTTGKLWRIIGFIDHPAVILDPVAEVSDLYDERQRQTVIMGSVQSEEFTRLVPEKTA